jgi:hypothetical protein
MFTTILQTMKTEEIEKDDDMPHMIPKYTVNNCHLDAEDDDFSSETGEDPVDSQDHFQSVEEKVLKFTSTIHKLAYLNICVNC